MKNHLRVIVLILFLPLQVGCASLKEQTGDYITEAVREKIVKDVDGILEKRGLSLKDLQSLGDLNNENKLTPKEMLTTVKDLAKDYMTMETKTLLDAKLEEYEKRLVSDDELSSRTKEFWLWLIGSFGALVSGYLTKQVVSAKKDGKRDERIAILEKLLHKDLDGDGRIGNGKSNGSGEHTNQV